MTTYIIGHQKPDTDSVVSAIALAKLLKLKHPNQKFIPVIADPLNPETTYIFKKQNLAPPQIITASVIKSKDKVILVDHNEESQRLNKMNPDQIVSIYDHHKLNLDLANPIKVLVFPWGATATIIWHLFKTEKTALDSQTAYLLLTAIISDTVGLKSATTTNKDKQAVKNLTQITNVKNLEQLSLEIFKAKSNIDSLSPQEIVKNDYKIYQFKNKKVFIGQLETVEQEKILKINQKILLEALNQIQQQQKTDFSFLAISDILKINTKLLITNQTIPTAEKAFGTKAQNNILDIGPLLSRKKQIAPAIEKTIQND